MFGKHRVQSRPDNDVLPRHGQVGMTLIELGAVLSVAALLVLALNFAVHLAIERAEVTSMKNRGRKIWCEIIATDSERCPIGLNWIEPRTIGFDATRTSTEYFRTLMSDTNGVIATKSSDQLCEGLTPSLLAGAGVPVAESAQTFTHTNNAWNVTCTHRWPLTPPTTPSEVPFLITRNADWGTMASTCTPIILTDTLPFRTRRVVWVSCEGACLDTTGRRLSTLQGSMKTNRIDIMRP